MSPVKDIYVIDEPMVKCQMRNFTEVTWNRKSMTKLWQAVSRALCDALQPVMKSFPPVLEARRVVISALLTFWGRGRANRSLSLWAWRPPGGARRQVQKLPSWALIYFNVCEKVMSAELGKICLEGPAVDALFNQSNAKKLGRASNLITWFYKVCAQFY